MSKVLDGKQIAKALTASKLELSVQDNARHLSPGLVVYGDPKTGAKFVRYEHGTPGLGKRMQTLVAEHDNAIAAANEALSGAGYTTQRVNKGNGEFPIVAVTDYTGDNEKAWTDTTLRTTSEGGGRKAYNQRKAAAKAAARAAEVDTEVYKPGTYFYMQGGAKRFRGMVAHVLEVYPAKQTCKVELINGWVLVVRIASLGAPATEAQYLSGEKDKTLASAPRKASSTTPATGETLPETDAEGEFEPDEDESEEDETDSDAEDVTE